MSSQLDKDAWIIMGADVEPEVIHVTFYLPHWFPPDRLDFGHPDMHRDAVYDNSAAVALHRLKEVWESDLALTQHPSVTITLTPRQDIAKAIKRFQAKLKRFLSRYKESKLTLKEWREEAQRK
jgi:hypothetical protein